MKRFCLLLLSIIIFSCSQDDNSTKTSIRIKNSSAFEFTNIRVNTSGGENIYEDLNTLETSDYKDFDFAYSYAFIELTIEGNTSTLQPIDYVGETKLAGGNYTYDLDAMPIGEEHFGLSLTLIKD